MIRPNNRGLKSDYEIRGSVGRTITDFFRPPLNGRACQPFSASDGMLPLSENTVKFFVQLVRSRKFGIFEAVYFFSCGAVQAGIHGRCPCVPYPVVHPRRGVRYSDVGFGNTPYGPSIAASNSIGKPTTFDSLPSISVNQSKRS